MLRKKLDAAYKVDFKTTPAIASACKQFYTNFDNMWSGNACKNDLRVAVTLILRINLARKRFFRKKNPSHEKSKKDVKEPVKSEQKSDSTRKMEELFTLLLKHRRGLPNKYFVIKSLISEILDPVIEEKLHVPKHKEEVSDDDTGTFML